METGYPEAVATLVVLAPRRTKRTALKAGIPCRRCSNGAHAVITAIRESTPNVSRHAVKQSCDLY
jgi:hypothetical protein